ncbi:MAG TPA: hypothetical protein DC049_04255 [Spirochaetia bacterium]|nr:hypothetical protein [Spirochaetia bacterium]
MLQKFFLLFFPVILVFTAAAEFEQEFSITFIPENRKYIFSNTRAVITFQEGNTVYSLGSFTFNLVKPFRFADGSADISPQDRDFIGNYLEHLKKKITRLPLIPEITEKPGQPIPVIPGTFPKQQKRSRINHVFIDAGHGGKDPGAGAYGFEEKDIVLQLARELYNLMKNIPDLDVYLVRSSDDFITLEKRCNFANSRLKKHENGLFISIHLNASFFPDARGAEVYYLSHDPTSEMARMVALLENKPFSLELTNLTGKKPVEQIISRLEVVQYQTESKMAAEFIDSEMLKLPRLTGSRGVKSALFYVLQGVLMPSVLVEIGFISNKSDIEYIASPDNHQEIMKAVSRGIRTYIELFEKSNGFTE